MQTIRLPFPWADFVRVGDVERLRQSPNVSVRQRDSYIKQTQSKVRTRMVNESCRRKVDYLLDISRLIAIWISREYDLSAGEISGCRQGTRIRSRERGQRGNERREQASDGRSVRTDYYVLSAGVSSSCGRGRSTSRKDVSATSRECDLSAGEISGCRGACFRGCGSWLCACSRG